MLASETLLKAFPNCPMCLGDTFIEIGKTRKGLLYTYTLRCSTCQALWRVHPNERHANAYDITLLEKGSNPRKLDLVPFQEVADLQFDEISRALSFHIEEMRHLDEVFGAPLFDDAQPEIPDDDPRWQQHEAHMAQFRAQYDARHMKRGEA